MEYAAGDMPSAVLRLQKSVELNPADAETHLFLGGALVRQCKIKEAREAFRAALRNSPSPKIQEEASRALAKLNEELGEE